jgi:hypothetical protein
MRKIALIGGILISIAASTATLATPQEQCNEAWLQADKDVDGDLSGSELMRYLFAIKKDGRHADAVKDGKIDVDEFMVACKDGVFDDIINTAQK